MNRIPSLEACEDFLKNAGPSNSLDKALLSKLNAHELRAMARQEAASAQAYLDSKRQQAKAAQSDLEKAAAAMRNRSSASPAIRPAPAHAPAPAAPAAETAREKYQRLQKTAPHEAGKFYQENKNDILWPNRITKSNS
jgi:FtsZ-interacting cell division protein ZipA